VTHHKTCLCPDCTTARCMKLLGTSAPAGPPPKGKAAPVVAAADACEKEGAKREPDPG
jgi:hypothetical protein